MQILASSRRTARQLGHRSSLLWEAAATGAVVNSPAKKSEVGSPTSTWLSKFAIVETVRNRFQGRQVVLVG